MSTIFSGKPRVRDCGRAPSASVSDPRVFTVVDLWHSARNASAVLEVVRANDGKSHEEGLRGQLVEYFRTATDGATTGPCRLHTMLDSPQSRTGHAELMQLAIALQYAKSMADSGADGSTEATKMNPVAGTSPAQLSDQILALLNQQAEASVADSPTDHLFRASDVIMLYLLAHLAVYGDSRAIAWDRQYWEKSDDPRLVFDPKNPNPKHRQRLLFLVFQATIDAGARADQMVGVRLKVTGAKPDPIQTDAINVLGLHPSRRYDVESALCVESRLKTLAVAASLAGYGGSADINNQAEARRQFLSRNGKVACYIDPNGEWFGWNFYPCNLKVIPVRTLLRRLLRAPATYKVQGFLESGGQDCAALLLVPPGLSEIRFEATYVHGSMDGSQLTEALARRTIKVTLPEYAPEEAVIPATPPTTQPSSQRCAPSDEREAKLATNPRLDEK